MPPLSFTRLPQHSSRTENVEEQPHKRNKEGPPEHGIGGGGSSSSAYGPSSLDGKLPHSSKAPVDTEPFAESGCGKVNRLGNQLPTTGPELEIDTVEWHVAVEKGSVAVVRGAAKLVHLD